MHGQFVRRGTAKQQNIRCRDKVAMYASSCFNRILSTLCKIQNPLYMLLSKISICTRQNQFAVQKDQRIRGACCQPFRDSVLRIAQCPVILAETSKSLFLNEIPDGSDDDLRYAKTILSKSTSAVIFPETLLKRPDIHVKVIYASPQLLRSLFTA